MRDWTWVSTWAIALWNLSFSFLNGQLKLVKYSPIYILPAFINFAYLCYSAILDIFLDFWRAMYPIRCIFQRLLYLLSELEHTLPLLSVDKQCCLTGTILGVSEVIQQHISRKFSFIDQEFFLMVFIKSCQKQLNTSRFVIVSNTWSANVPVQWNHLASAHFKSLPGFHYINGTFYLSPSQPIQKEYLIVETKHNPQVRVHQLSILTEPK